MRRSKRKAASALSSSNISSPVVHSTLTESQNSRGNNCVRPAKLSKQVKNNSNVKSPKPGNSKTGRTLKSSEPFTYEEQFPEKNPLLTHVVFSKILKFDLSLHDIKQLRLVCKTWYKYSLNKYRSNVTIRLGPTGKNLWGELDWSDVWCRAWNVVDYFKRFIDPNDFYELATYPYKKYNFKGLYFESNEIFLAETENFWDVIGPNIWHLKFDNCTFPAEGRARNFDRIFTENLQNLETLDFSECQMFPNRETEKLFDNSESFQTIFQTSPRRNLNLKKLTIFNGCLPMDLSILLINSPNIESIDLDCQIQNEHKFYQQLADICNARRIYENQSYPLREIKLNLKTASARDTANLWTSMNLPLEHVSYASMPVGGITTGISAVSAITASCASTLKTLEVFQPPVLSHISLHNLPAGLSHLEEIYCYGNVFDNYTFVNGLPNLKVLYLDYMLYNNLDKIFKLTKGSDYLWQLERKYCPLGHSAILPGLQRAPGQRVLGNLVRFHFDMYLDSPTWANLPQWMPNLKTLEALLRQETFGIVCRHFAGLEELVVLCESYVGDCEVTGWKDDNASENRNPDNLTNITSLRKFVLKKICGKYCLPILLEGVPLSAPGYDEAEGLGDRSVFFGFLEMSNLEEVQFHASENMTDDAVAALKLHVSKVDIIRSYGDTPHGNGECCKIAAFLQSARRAQKNSVV